MQVPALVDFPRFGFVVLSNHLHSPSHPNGPFGQKAGMTLTELLTVIAVIALLIGAATSIFRGPRSEITTKGAVDAVAAMVEQASSIAKSRRSPTRLVVNIDPTSTSFARQISVFSKGNDNQWTLRAGPHLLPSLIYFDEAYSEGFVSARYQLNNATAQSGTTGTLVAAYEFDHNGHFITPDGATLPRLVVVPGVVREAAQRVLAVGPHQENLRSGFLFRRYGNVTRFHDQTQLPAPSNTQ